MRGVLAVGPQGVGRVALLDGARDQLDRRTCPRAPSGRPAVGPYRRVEIGRVRPPGPPGGQGVAELRDQQRVECRRATAALSWKPSLSSILMRMGRWPGWASCQASCRRDSRRDPGSGTWCAVRPGSAAFSQLLLFPSGLLCETRHDCRTHWSRRRFEHAGAGVERVGEVPVLGLLVGVVHADPGGGVRRLGRGGRTRALRRRQTQCGGRRGDRHRARVPRPAGRGFPRVAHLPPPLPLPSHVGSSVREGRTGGREELRHIGVLRGQAATSSRAAAVIASASIPAWFSCSSGVPDPGMVRTASRTKRGAGRPSAKASATASPDTALGVVVLDGDQAARLLGGGLQERLGVHRLDRVEVDDAHGDALLRPSRSAAARLVDGDSGRDERHPVARSEAAAPWLPPTGNCSSGP